MTGDVAGHLLLSMLCWCTEVDVVLWALMFSPSVSLEVT